jgi:DNA-binding NarL/FixJ family response regulator
MAPALTTATPKSSARTMPTPGGSLRILLAERKASAHSDLSSRLKSRGHEVLARVTSAQGAIDYAGFLTPDVVLVSPLLEDASGLTVAMTVARKQPGIAAVVLTDHPAAANPACRPNWGSVALLPADAEADEMHEQLWRAVMQAREVSAMTAPAQADDELPIDPAPASSMFAESTESVETALAAAIAADESAARAANLLEDQTVTDMVDALYSPPAIELVTTPVVPGTRPSNPMQESDDDVVARATSALVERARLTRVTAMRLMEQEAADSGQSLGDVARAMLFDVESDSIEVLAPGE